MSVVRKTGVASSMSTSALPFGSSVDAEEVRAREVLARVSAPGRAARVGDLRQLVARRDGVPDVDGRLLGHAVVERERRLLRVLDLGREHAALDGDDLRDLVALGVLSLDDDLAVERERHERHRARRDWLGEAFADELPSPKTVTGPLSSALSVGFLKRTRRNGILRVAARALGVVEVDDLAVGLGAEDRDHRRRAARRRVIAALGLEVRGADRLASRAVAARPVSSRLVLRLRRSLAPLRAAAGVGASTTRAPPLRPACSPLPTRDDAARIDAAADELLAEAVGALERGASSCRCRPPRVALDDDLVLALLRSELRHARIAIRAAASRRRRGRRRRRRHRASDAGCLAMARRPAVRPAARRPSLRASACRLARRCALRSVVRRARASSSVSVGDDRCWLAPGPLAGRTTRRPSAAPARRDRSSCSVSRWTRRRPLQIEAERHRRARADAELHVLPVLARRVVDDRPALQIDLARLADDDAVARLPRRRLGDVREPELVRRRGALADADLHVDGAAAGARGRRIGDRRGLAGRARRRR